MRYSEGYIHQAKMNEINLIRLRDRIRQEMAIAIGIPPSFADRRHPELDIIRAFSVSAGPDVTDKNDTGLAAKLENFEKLPVLEVEVIGGNLRLYDRLAERRTRNLGNVRYGVAKNYRDTKASSAFDKAVSYIEKKWIPALKEYNKGGPSL